MAFLIYVRQAGRISGLILHSMGMSKELLQKLTNSGILVESDQMDWYEVNDDVFKQ